jgi:hypothetical protein
MSNSSDQNDLGFETARCDVAGGHYPEIHPDEAKLVRKPCSPIPLDLVSCKNTDQQLYLDEIGGLNLGNIEARPDLVGPEIPEFIPVLDTAFFNTADATRGFEYVGFSEEDLFTSSVNLGVGKLEITNLKFTKRIASGSALVNKKNIMFSSGHDQLIESVWHRRHELGYYEHLRSLGLAGTTGVDFSVFRDECPFGQRLNIKKSLKSFAEYQEAGIPSVPNVYWANPHQLNDWVKWLRSNPSVKLISINCQCLKRYKDIDLAVADIKLLAKELPHIHFLLEGPKERVLLGLKDWASRIHVAMKMPGVQAMYRVEYILHRGRLIKIPRSRLDPHLLAGRNFRVYKKYLDQIFFGSLPPKPLIRVPLRTIWNLNKKT